MKLNRLLLALGFCLWGAAYAQDLSIIVDKKGRVGFADSNGKEVIKCSYESARPFSEGVAVVMKSGKYGMINTKGKVVLPLKYNSLSSWTDELYIVKAGKLSGLVNHQGKIVLPVKYSFISKPNCYGKSLLAVGGKATVEQKKTYMANAKYGIIDNHGKILIQPTYKGLFEFDYDGSNESIYHQGKRLIYSYHFITDTLTTDCSYLGVHKLDGTSIFSCGIVDATGKLLLKQGLYTFVMKPSNGMVRYYIAKKKETVCGYHNLSTGKSLQAAKFNSPMKEITFWTHGDFSGEIAPVNGTNWSFIDRSGKTVRSGYTQVAQGTHVALWGALNNTGTWDVFDNQNKDIPTLSGYNNIAFPLQEGDQEVFTVKKGTKYGCINRQGSVVIPFEYDEACANVFDVVAVKKNGKWGAVSASNKPMIPLEYASLKLPTERNAQHFWVMKSDSLYYHYHVEKQFADKTGYRATGNFHKGIAMVAPVNLILEDTPINRAQLFKPNASAADLAAADLTKSRDSFGYILRAEDDVIIFNRPVSTLYIDAVATAIWAKGNRDLSDFEKKDLLLEVTKGNRSYSLTGDMNDKISSFMNSVSTKKLKNAELKQKAQQFTQDYATELQKARLSEDEWNY